MRNYEIYKKYDNYEEYKYNINPLAHKLAPYKPFIIFISSLIFLYIVYYIFTLPTATGRYTEKLNYHYNPRQKNLTKEEQTYLAPKLRVTGYNKTFCRNLTLYPQAEYTIVARVISKGKYNWDSRSVFIPYDLGLAWGYEGDPFYTDLVQYWNRYRRLNIMSCSDIIDSNDLQCHVANVHVIPATTNLRRCLGSLKKGDIVLLQGYLVNATWEDFSYNFYTTNTSLTRTDQGDGACETMYIQKIMVNQKIYQ